MIHVSANIHCKIAKLLSQCRDGQNTFTVDCLLRHKTYLLQESVVACEDWGSPLSCHRLQISFANGMSFSEKLTNGEGVPVTPACTGFRVLSSCRIWPFLDTSPCRFITIGRHCCCSFEALDHLYCILGSKQSLLACVATACNVDDMAFTSKTAT